MAKRQQIWWRSTKAATRYSRGGFGGKRDDGNSLSVREWRIFQYAWEQGRKVGLRDSVRRRK